MSEKFAKLSPSSSEQEASSRPLYERKPAAVSMATDVSPIEPTMDTTAPIDNNIDSNVPPNTNSNQPENNNIDPRIPNVDEDPDFSWTDETLFVHHITITLNLPPSTQKILL